MDEKNLSGRCDLDSTRDRLPQTETLPNSYIGTTCRHHLDHEQRYSICIPFVGASPTALP